MAASASVLNTNRGIAVGTVNLGTYATGGVAVSPALFGFSKLFYLDVAPSNGITFQYLPASGKVQAFWSGSSGSRGSEVTNATSLSADNPQFHAVGV